MDGCSIPKYFWRFEISWRNRASTAMQKQNSLSHNHQNSSEDDHKEARAEHETAELNLSEEQSAA